MLKSLFGIFLASFLLSNSVTVSRIQIKGNTRTDSSLIRHYLYIKPGHNYRMDELKTLASRSEKRLLNTFYFYAAKILIVPLYDGSVKILVRIQEGFLFRFGGSPYGASIGKENILGRGFSIDTMFGPSSLRFAMQLPYLFNSPLAVFSSVSTLAQSLDIAGAGNSVDLLSYREKQASLGLAWQIAPDLRIGISQLYNTYRFQDRGLPIQAVANLHRAQTHDALSIHTFFMTYRNLNHYMHPTSGWDVTLYGEAYKGARQGLLKLRYFHPLSSRASLDNKISIAASSGVPDLTRLVALDQFNGLTAREMRYRHGMSAYLVSLNLDYLLTPLPVFRSQLYINGFYQTGQILARSLPLDEPVSAGGIGAEVFFPYPINVRVMAKLGISEGGAWFVWTITSNLGTVMNEL